MATTYTLDAPGATLHYDVHESDSTGHPALLLIGSPMGAAGFGSLRRHFTDRTVVTYDPRGSERSVRTDDTLPTAQAHADDVRRVIDAVGGPVDLFASSGGAVNALELVSQHPETVKILVAHEPPIFDVLPDREQAEAASRAIASTYQRDGFGAAMARFIALVGLEGPIPDGFAERPAPDPAAFGLPTEDDGSRDDPLFANMAAATHHGLDYEALRRASTRIVVGVGAESRNQLPGRSAVAIAEVLGREAVEFPGGHDGFLGGEYGQTGKPDEFAAALREVLTEGA